MLSFSTLACPEWSPNDIVRRATAMGFSAIEWRGGVDGHVADDAPRAQVRGLRQRVEDAGLASLALTTYGSLVADEPFLARQERERLRRRIDIAGRLGAAFTRVFVGIPAQVTDSAALVDRAVENLRTVASDAIDAGVGIALEPHDLHVLAGSLVPILERTRDLPVGVIWEVGNAWQHGEDPGESLPLIHPWIRYVQLKDGTGTGRAWRLCSLGAGEVPLDQVLRALDARGPMPPLSVEWERPWDERLEPAEIALPAALAHVRSLLKGVRASALRNELAS